MNLNNLLDNNIVIPAQAGIQSIEESRRSWTKQRYCSLRGLIFLLDSRLRGNDGLVDYLR